MKGKVIVIAAASLLGFALLSPDSLGKIHRSYNGNQDHVSDFSWESITPTKELIWHECYEDLQCARLEVPLDYANPEWRKAAIAVTRKRALVSSRLPGYKGPILFNPGGPGGSGIDFLRRSGSLLSVVLGPHFDLVSFDPRGVRYSTPRASFFKTDAERVLFGEDGADHRVSNSSEGGISNAWAKWRLMAMLAKDRDDGYLVHINTPNTARDMLKIVEAYGEDKLQYWGFSYGTLLGATFATMFPDKVKRMVLDGVVYPEDYYSASWKASLLDTDKAFDAFFTGCAKAGLDRCALYSPVVDDIRRNVTRILEKIKRQPIPVKTEASYGVVDLLAVRSAIFFALYSPWALFQSLAEALAKLATGDAVPIFSMPTWRQSRQPGFECSCDGRKPQPPTLGEGTISILCNDGDKVPLDLSNAEDHFRDALKRSEFGDLFAGVRMYYTGWPNPSRSFEGPLEANTSHPILLVGNTADPVTPLDAAKKLSANFEGSVVLTQNSAGHCSLSTPSICTQLYINQYLSDGTLPKPGTVCETTGSDFPPREGQRMHVRQEQSPMHGDERAICANFALREALERLSSLYPVYIPSY